MKLLTTQDIARGIGVHPETVRRWIRQRKLPALYASQRTVRVRADVVEEFLRVNGITNNITNNEQPTTNGAGPTT